jgi:MoxR-like ATPase
MNPTAPRAGGLLERDAEVAAVEEGLAAAASGRGGVLVVEGPAGIGKTRLVEAARSAARAHGPAPSSGSSASASSAIC